jgi:hypothetical protein
LSMTDETCSEFSQAVNKKSFFLVSETWLYYFS